MFFIQKIRVTKKKNFHKDPPIYKEVHKENWTEHVHALFKNHPKTMNLFDYLDSFQPANTPEGLKSLANNAGKLKGYNQLERDLEVLRQILCEHSQKMPELLAEWQAIVANDLVCLALQDRFLVLAGRIPAKEHYLQNLYAQDPRRNEEIPEETFSHYQMEKRIDRAINPKIPQKKKELCRKFISEILPEVCKRAAKFDATSKFQRTKFEFKPKDFNSGKKFKKPGEALEKRNRKKLGLVSVAASP